MVQYLTADGKGNTSWSPHQRRIVSSTMAHLQFHGDVLRISNSHAPFSKKDKWFLSSSVKSNSPDSYSWSTILVVNPSYSDLSLRHSSLNLNGTFWEGFPCHYITNKKHDVRDSKALLQEDTMCSCWNCFFHGMCWESKQVPFRFRFDWC